MQGLIQQHCPGLLADGLVHTLGQIPQRELTSMLADVKEVQKLSAAADSASSSALCPAADPAPAGSEDVLVKRQRMTMCDYDALSHDSLVDLCVAKDSMIARLRDQIRDLRRPSRVVVAQADPAQDLFKVERIGSLRLTTVGQLAVGMRSICASTAASDLGLVLAEGLGGGEDGHPGAAGLARCMGCGSTTLPPYRVGRVARGRWLPGGSALLPGRRNQQLCLAAVQTDDHDGQLNVCHRPR